MSLTPLYTWYESAKRELPWRETSNPYFIWLSEIILQQTRVMQGMEYYFRFTSRFPTVDDLAAADEDEVLRLWQGLGYYSRARNLHAAAKLIVANHWQPFPTTFEQIITLPGVGEYTAGAIMSFAYDAPYPAADGNVYRVLSRLFDLDEPFDTTAGKKLFRQHAYQLLPSATPPPDSTIQRFNDSTIQHPSPRLHNSAIMEFGALYCVPQNPDCPHCPLASICKAYASGTVNLLPVRKPRVKPRDRYFLYHVYLTPSGQTLLHRRTAKDIWYHLYEFPLDEQDAPLAQSAQYLHVLSHQRIHAEFVVHRVASLPVIPDTFPIAWSDLDDYALSVLTLRFLDDFQFSS